MDRKITMTFWQFCIAVVFLLMLWTVIFAFWRPITEGKIKKLVVGPVIIEMNGSKIPEAGQEVIVPLEELGASGKVFILGRERGEYDAVCTDPESSDPDASPQRIMGLRKEAAAWKKLENLKLADARPAKGPYLWCKAGATQTYALTELGLEVKSYLETVLLEAVKFKKA